MDENGTYSGAVIARLLGISERRVQELARSGALPKARRGRYPLIECVQGYCAHLRRAIEQRVGEDDDGGNGLSRQRARLAREQADRVALANAELRGDLGRISVWMEELAGLLGEIRAALLSLPSSQAPLLDGDLAHRNRVLTVAVNAILDRIVAYRPTRRTARDASGDPESAAGGETPADVDCESMGGSIPPPQRGKQRRSRPVEH